MNRLHIALAILGLLAVVFYFFQFDSRSSIVITDTTRIDVPQLRSDIAKSVRTVGGNTAYRKIATQYETATFDQQHNVAHIFGETLYEVEGISGVASCDPTFAFGCYHGFFSRAVASEGLSIVTLMDDACGSVLDVEPSACRHGIGHGILEYVGSQHLEEALKVCLETTQPDPLAGCTSGVFMEHNVPLAYAGDGNFFTEPRILNSENPYEPCTEVDEHFQQSCYHELPQWWVQVYDHDYQVIGRLCSGLDSSLSRACFSGLGGVVAPTAAFDPQLAREYCEKIDDSEGAYLCRASAAWSITLDGGGIEQSRGVCDASIKKYNFSCPIDSKVTQ